MKSNWLKLYSLESLQRCARCTFLPLCNSPYCTIHGLPQQKVLANKIQFNLAKKTQTMSSSNLRCFLIACFLLPLKHLSSVVILFYFIYLCFTSDLEGSGKHMFSGSKKELQKKWKSNTDPKALPRLWFFFSSNVHQSREESRSESAKAEQLTEVSSRKKALSATLLITDSAFCYSNVQFSLQTTS